MSTLAACSSSSESMLGFDLENAIIPISEIHRGGPPPDGIPAIDNPQFISVDAVSYLRDDDTVIGIAREGVVRAYPFRILIWHEIVNDTVGEASIAVTYCPLCASAMIFSREFDGKVITFGVSGLLHNSDVLMFDRETRSLWSQLGMKAVSGEFVGTELDWMASEQMDWRAWREKYPESEVLNLNTGYHRDYLKLPYGDYFRSPGTMFPFRDERGDLPAKTLVASVRYRGEEKAYPLNAIPQGEEVTDTLDGYVVRFFYDPESEQFQMEDEEGEAIPAVLAYWFAWQAFYPDTLVWKEP